MLGSGLGRKESCLLTYNLRSRPHLRAARADSPRRTRGQSARRADDPAPQRGRSDITSRTSSTAPGSFDVRGRSALHRRTVRQVRPDSPTSLFLFSLIYSEIKIGVMNMLGSLLKNHEVHMRKTSFTKIREQKHKIGKK
jgi:hypothetical protein